MFFIGCDSANYTIIDVVNGSSYDLHIKFIKSRKAFSSADIDIDVKKGETGTFNLYKHMGPNSPLDPNYEIEKIVFSNLDTDDIIKEMVNNNLFRFLNSSGSPKTDYYILEISDDLFEN
jgi:hypothetical protein